MYDHERSLVDEYSGRPFVLLGVNNDKTLKRVKTAVKKNNLNWRSWFDGRGGPIVGKFGVSSFPTVFLVDHHGVIRYHSPQGKELDEAIEKLVKEAEADGVVGGSQPTREFKDITGKHTMVGSYVEFEKGKVVILKDDGEDLEVPWKKLSLEDRQYVADQRLRSSGLDHIAKRNIEFEFDEPESFVDVTGKHEMVGTYIGLFDGKYIIWDRSGKEIRVGRDKLNDETKDLIKKINKRRRG